MPPARPDIIATRDENVPFSQRRACSGCRAIKSRCMVQERGSACSRCVRLGLECNFLEHHRGVKREQEEKPANDGRREKKKVGRKRQDRTASSSSGRESSSDASGKAGSTENEKKAVFRTPHQSFSIESMLAVDDATISSNSALLSSTAFAVLQDDETTENMQTKETDEVKVDDCIVESLLTARVFRKDQITELIEFYFDKLNPVIALLDPVLYNADALMEKQENRMLLATVCTVSAKFCIPEAYDRCLEFLERPLQRICTQDVMPQLDYVLSLSILAMWKHPQDGSSWRKLRIAITMALELGLHLSFNEVFTLSHSRTGKKAPVSARTAQKQRTFLQLACFEDGYQDQRRMPMAIDKSLLPEPWQWIEYLGDQVQDIDIRLAASRENALVKQNLWQKLRREGGGRTGGSKAVALKRVQLIEMAIAAEEANTRVWKDPEMYGLGKGRTHSGRPCLLFHTANTMFNYHCALFAIYSSASLSKLHLPRKHTVFLECCRLSIELFELIAGPYGQEEYYRFVHDIVILNLAVAAVWISDNWCRMPVHLAAQAAAAVDTAARVTASSLHRHAEQSAYLARFMAFCARRISMLRISVDGQQQQQQQHHHHHQQPLQHEHHAQNGTAAALVGQSPLLSSSAASFTSQQTAPENFLVQTPLLSSVSPESLSLANSSNNNLTGDPVLQYLQDLLTMPCIQMDEADNHNILSFFNDDRNKFGF